MMEVEFKNVLSWGLWLFISEKISEYNLFLVALTTVERLEFIRNVVICRNIFVEISLVFFFIESMAF